MRYTSTYAQETGHRLARNLTLTPAGESAAVAEEAREIRSGWNGMGVGMATNLDPCGKAYTDGFRSGLAGINLAKPTEIRLLKCWNSGWIDGNDRAVRGRAKA